MDAKTRNEQYNKYVEAKIPKTKWFPTILNAFWVGGLICVIGELFNSFYMNVAGLVDASTAWKATLVTLIFLASILTGFGIWDKIGAFGGAGAVIPITGFSNSITSPAIEFKHEGLVFGMMVKMFTVAGPVIVSGIVASFLVGFVYLFIPF